MVCKTPASYWQRAVRCDSISTALLTFPILTSKTATLGWATLSSVRERRAAAAPLSAVSRHLYRPQNRFGLVHGFLEFLGGIGIGDYARACLQVSVLA